MKKLLLLFFILSASASAVFIPVYFLADRGIINFNSPDRGDFPVRGIDISHHQGIIDWDLVKGQNLDFVFIKATEGSDFRDSMFSGYAAGAAAAGIPSGAYHFFTFRSSGREQAENFISAVGKNSISLPPAVDVEFGGNSENLPSLGRFEKEFNDYLEMINVYYGKKPVVYATYEFYRRYLNKIKISHPYSLWIRNILYQPGKFDGIEWDYWQYCSRGRVSGIRGPVDLNAFRYGKKEFEKIME